MKEEEEEDEQEEEEEQDQFERARKRVVARLDTAIDETDLERLLDWIIKKAKADLQPRSTLGPPESARLLEAAHAWPSLVSYATGRFYTELPAEVGTPFRKIGGWSKEVAKKLDQLSQMLRPALHTALQHTQATSFSIGVQFPWGVSVSLEWETPA